MYRYGGLCIAMEGHVYPCRAMYSCGVNLLISAKPQRQTNGKGAGSLEAWIS